MVRGPVKRAMLGVEMRAPEERWKTRSSEMVGWWQRNECAGCMLHESWSANGF